MNNRIMPDPVHVYVQVLGYDISDNFAVTPAFWSGHEYVITHKKTGNCIGGGIGFETPEEAAEAALEIETLGISWDEMIVGSVSDAGSHNANLLGEGGYSKMIDIMVKHGGREE